MSWMMGPDDLGDDDDDIRRSQWGSGIRFREGEMALLDGRVVEVAKVSKISELVTVSFIDEGKVVHQITLNGHYRLDPLVRPGETVLDAINKTAAKRISRKETTYRIAERWLADPKAGDVFVGHGLLFELVNFGAREVIKLNVRSAAPDDSYWRPRTERLHDLDELRQRFKHSESVGYFVRAHSTLRPDHPKLHRSRLPTNSPLFLPSDDST